MKVRKYLKIMTALLGVSLLIASCTNAEAQSPNISSEAPKKEEEQQGSGSAEDIKTGLGVITLVTQAEDASADGNGTLQVETTVAAVTLDKEGKILKCAIDQVQSTFGFNNDGEILNDGGIYKPTKTELGDEYGMKTASAIGKEWYEQVDAYCKWTIGKTINDIKGIDVSEAKDENGADLTSSVTIKTENFVEAIEKAVKNAA